MWLYSIFSFFSGAWQYQLTYIKEFPEGKSLGLANLWFFFSRIITVCFLFLLITNQYSLFLIYHCYILFVKIVVFDVIYRGSRGPAGFTGVWRNPRVCQITCTVWPWCLWPSLILQWTRTGASLARFPLWTAVISFHIHRNSYNLLMLIPTLLCVGV